MDNKEIKKRIQKLTEKNKENDKIITREVFEHLDRELAVCLDKLEKEIQKGVSVALPIHLDFNITQIEKLFHSRLKDKNICSIVSKWHAEKEEEKVFRGARAYNTSGNGETILTIALL